MSIPRDHSLPTVDLVLIGGVQGSGKTYVALRFFNDRIRVNLDEIRKFYKGMTRGEDRCQGDFHIFPHALLADIERMILQHHLDAGDPLVVDNTMIVPEYRECYVRQAHESGRTVGMLFLDYPIEKCLAYNRLKPRVLPPDLLKRFHDERLLPTLAEGYDWLRIVRSEGDLEAAVADLKSPERERLALDEPFSVELSS